MTKHTKIVYWSPKSGARNRRTPCTLHLICNTYDGHLSTYRRLAGVLRKTVPFAKDEDIVCSHVGHSTSIGGHILLSWSGVLKRSHLRGYRIGDINNCGYSW